LIYHNTGGCWVEFRKDIYNKEELSVRGLNERQIDALLFFKAKGEITSSEYAQKYNISDRTARTDLTELVEKELLNKQGETKLAVYIFPIRK
jgi:ATP-dependent DNA helicase RecG